MNKQMNRWWCLVLVVGVAVSVESAGITYPAVGNLRLEQGTLEIWFTPYGVDLQRETDWSREMSLFAFESPHVFGMGGGYSIKGARRGAHISMSNRVGARNILRNLVGRNPDWRAGELAHYAFVWDGEEMRHYGNGQRLGAREQRASLAALMRLDARALGAEELVIGDHRGRDAGLILHAVRVSAIARAPETSSMERPDPDLHTLLLDRFDLPGHAPENGRTRAVVISGLSGETGGRVLGVVQPMETPRPGLLMNRAP